MFSRSQPFFRPEAFARLGNARVILFGAGGVGSWTAECLVRTGLLNLTIVDFDTVAESNINRQIQATTATIGMPKSQTLHRHLSEINPEAHITAIDRRFCEATCTGFDLQSYDYVIDAIDSVADKALLILQVTSLRHTKLFSSMGAARRTDPARIKSADFSKVTGCPLARALRQRFKKTGMYPKRRFKAVFSDEPAITLPDGLKGSLCQVTAVFGMHLASLVINDIISGPADQTGLVATAMRASDGSI